MESPPNESLSIEFDGELARPRMFYRQWMLAGNPAYFFDRLVQDFGDFVHYRGLFNFYLVNHPSLAKQVLQDTNKTFDKNTIIYKRFRNAFGDGLVVAEGERWKRQRKLLQPMFGQLAVERYFDIMVDAANALADGWDQSSKYRGPFDVAKEMNDVTLEIAGRSLFHDGFDQARDRIGHWTETINRYSAKPPLPIVRSFWFPSRRNRMLKQTLREFHEFLSAMIANRRAGQRKEDLLGVLLHATHDESGRTMTDQEIVRLFRMTVSMSSTPKSPSIPFSFSPLGSVFSSRRANTCR